MGGVIAQAMATILEKEEKEQGQHPVALVVVIDSRIRGRETNNEMEDKKITGLLIDRLQRAIQPTPIDLNHLSLSEQVTQQEQWQVVDSLLTQLFHQSPATTPFIPSSSSSSPFAMRFTFLFRKHLHLLSTHTPLPSSSTTLVLSCVGQNGKKDNKNEGEWQEICNNSEFLLLPASFTHNSVMYDPCIKYVASVITGRIACLE